MKEAFIAAIKASVDLPVSVIEEFWYLGKVRNFKKGDMLAKPDQMVDYGYFLFKGICQFHFIGDDGREVVSTFRSGPCIMAPSTSGFFLNQPAQIYCVAVTDLEGIQLDATNVMRFADKHPEIYRMFLKVVVNIFREKERKEVSLKQKSGIERYLDFLIDFPGLVNHVSLHAIASYLKLRAGSLSRIRKELRS